MEDFFGVPDGELSITLRALRHILRQRGWQDVKIIRGKWNYIFATRPDGKKLRFKNCTAPTTSCMAAAMADDKLATYKFLKKLGVKQPETVVFTGEESLQRMLDKYGKVVIKPLDGAHGDGVHTDIETLEEGVRAAKEINRGGEGWHNGQVLVQEQLMPENYELRITCIGYKFVTAYARIPAMVTGDGEHTISELIQIENQTVRGEIYKEDLSGINENDAEVYVKKHKLAETVPAAGERVQVIGVCNMGKGGTQRNMTDVVSEELKMTAERIAREMELPVVGIDFLDDYVLEVNAAPGLYDPVEGGEGGMEEYCVEKWVDFLGEV